MRIPYSGEQQNTGLSGPPRSSLFSHPHHFFRIAWSATEKSFGSATPAVPDGSEPCRGRYPPPSGVPCWIPSVGSSGEPPRKDGSGSEQEGRWGPGVGAGGKRDRP
jgi:hypothetical protein